MNDDTTAPMYCYRHPDRETRLRCSRCDKPICTRCAIKTPTGYRCPDCVRSQQKIFDTAKTSDYLIAFIIAAVLSFIGSRLTSRVGFFTILIAPAAGAIIAGAVRAATGRRRSKTLFRTATAAAAIGSLPAILTTLVYILFSSRIESAIFNFLPLVWQGVYISLVTSTVYYRLSGIQIRSR
jgi:hypothetical protein